MLNETQLDEATLEILFNISEKVTYSIFVISTLFYMVLVWLILKKSSPCMGAYRWYLLFNSTTYYACEFIYAICHFTPLKPYINNNGTTVNMFVAGGLFRIWHPNMTIMYGFINFFNFTILIMIYSVVFLFIYRYFQTTENGILDHLTSTKSVLYHIILVAFLSAALLVPNTDLTDEEILDYTQNMDQDLYGILKDGMFYGTRNPAGLMILVYIFCAFLGVTAFLIMCSSFYATYRFLNKQKNNMSPTTFKLFHVLMNHLALEIGFMIIFIIIPALMFFIHRGLDTNLNRSVIIERFITTLPIFFMPASDIMKMLYITPYRKGLKQVLARFNIVAPDLIVIHVQSTLV